MLKSDHRAVLGFHQNGILEFANPAASQMFGRQLVGVSLDDILPQAHERLMTPQRSRLWSIGRRSDGTPFPARVIVEPLPGEDGDRRFLARVASLTGKSSSEPTLAGLINGMSDAATLWDHADRLLLWNDRAMEIHSEIAGMLVLGARFEEFMARCAALDSPDGDRPESIAGAMARHRSASGEREEISVGRKQLLVAERRLPGGAVLRLESEITEQNLREVELRAAKEKAEAASHSKSTFLANMSHELRTPLNAVIGFSDILKSQLLGPIGNPKYLEYATHISDSGAHLLHLVNYILDLSRIEAGRYELRREPLAPGELVADVLRLVRISADKSNIELVTKVGPELPLITVDRRAIRQVLLNILSNAIKFTPAGGRVSIAADTGDRTVAIVVRDTGIGIAKEDLPRLTNPFEQAGDAYARSQGGAGLGLAITKQLVELHGGTMRIDSVIGEGTTVAVQLPVSDEPADIDPAE